MIAAGKLRGLPCSIRLSYKVLSWHKLQISQSSTAPARPWAATAANCAISPPGPGGHRQPEAIRRAGVEPGEIDHAVFGNAQQTSGDAIYGARHVALKAGVPIEVPALTVNRLCGSGMQSVVSAAQMIQLGEAKTVLAGGMESMSQAPHVIRGMRWGVGLGEGKLEDSLMVALLDTYCGLYMANTAELYAEQQGITREKQDEFALRSQQNAPTTPTRPAACRKRSRPWRCAIAKASRRARCSPKTTIAVPRPPWTSCAKLKPAFGKNGTVTAGNASGIVDGGAAVVVMPLDEAQKRNLKPMGRIVSWGIAGVDPKIMGSGPVPATRIALKKAGLKLDDIDLIEVNEAFAGQYLAVEKELGLDREQGQRERRRDRARPSAGRDRHASADHAAARAAPPQSEVRLGHRLHRRRPGHRDDRGEPAAVRTGLKNRTERLE